MMKQNFNFIILLFFMSSVCDGSTKVTIHGVSHLCENPAGRLGRCISKDKCHSHMNCDHKESIWQCPNGHGHPPHVCCVFRKNIIVFPDDEDARPTIRTTSAAPASSLKHRFIVQESHGRGILFPDENGNFNIPSSVISATSAPITSTTTSRTPSPTSSPATPPTSPPTSSPPALQRAAKTGSVIQNRISFFPKPPECGPMSLGDKIHGGAEAELGEFPWLVNLEYRTVFDDLVIACAGNIINHRYVLTAGHCVKGKIEEEVGKLESLRAGDHNTELDMDCDKLSCIGPYERYAIMESVVHENYRYTKKKQIFYDIALLKTDRSMRYSFAIAPVCLPTAMPSLTPPIMGIRMTVAGWGRSDTANYTDEKRIVDVPYVDNEVCPFNVESHQLCAGGVAGKDSCAGDSGGSLARRSAGAWIMEGIVSYGRGCGSNKPAIYTRIRHFIQWIQEHVGET